jgi:hypothetical protein
MTVIICKACNECIDDDRTESILCDICQMWFHADKKCSLLKKTLFRNITKNDQWACPICIKFFHDSYSGIETDGETIRLQAEEITRLSLKIDDLTKQNGNLLDQLGLKEAELIELRNKATS